MSDGGGSRAPSALRPPPAQVFVQLHHELDQGHSVLKTLLNPDRKEQSQCSFSTSIFAAKKTLGFLL